LRSKWPLIESILRIKHRVARTFKSGRNVGF